MKILSEKWVELEDEILLFFLFLKEIITQSILTFNKIEEFRNIH